MELQDILGKRKKSIKDERRLARYLKPTLYWQLSLRVLTSTRLFNLDLFSRVQITAAHSNCICRATIISSTPSTHSSGPWQLTST